MHGASHPKATSSSTNPALPRWAVIAALLLAGMLAAYLHQVLRWPLRMPGRHGLELMAILLFARCTASERYAGSMVGLGSAGVTLWLSPEVSFAPFIFMLQGLALDLVYPRLRAMVGWVWTLAFAAALIHALSPLLKWVLQQTTAFNTDALVAGLAYPVSTHLLFGFVGGLCGTLAWKAAQRQKRG